MLFKFFFLKKKKECFETFSSILKNAAKHTLLPCLSKTTANLLFIATFHKRCKENAAKQKLYCIIFKKCCNRKLMWYYCNCLKSVAKHFVAFFGSFTAFCGHCNRTNFL